MAEKIDQNEVDRIIGAIFSYSRIRYSELLHDYSFFDVLGARASELTIQMDENSKDFRLISLLFFLQTSLAAALQKTLVYHKSYDHFEQSFDRKKGATALSNQSAHIAYSVVNDIAIELFNFRELLNSEEFGKLVEKDNATFVTIVDELFPKVTYARHAVTHAHDRNMGRARDKKINDSAVHYRIDRDGKCYMDEKGDDFMFKFSEAKFIQLLDRFQEAIKV